MCIFFTIERERKENSKEKGGKEERSKGGGRA